MDSSLKEAYSLSWFVGILACRQCSKCLIWFSSTAQQVHHLLYFTVQKHMHGAASLKYHFEATMQEIPAVRALARFCDPFKLIYVQWTCTCRWHLSNKTQEVSSGQKTLYMRQHILAQNPLTEFQLKQVTCCWFHQEHPKKTLHNQCCALFGSRK